MTIRLYKQTSAYTKFINKILIQSLTTLLVSLILPTTIRAIPIMIQRIENPNRSFNFTLIFVSDILSVHRWNPHSYRCMKFCRVGLKYIKMYNLPSVDGGCHLTHLMPSTRWMQNYLLIFLFKSTPCLAIVLFYLFIHYSIMYKY